jgi:hypothetical protein
MFTATKKYSPNDPALIERYCTIMEISDWRQLPKGQIGAMVFVEMPAFWKARAEWLKTEDPSELLKDTPVEGAHSLPGTPAFERLNG